MSKITNENINSRYDSAKIRSTQFLWWYNLFMVFKMSLKFTHFDASKFTIISRTRQGCKLQLRRACFTDGGQQQKHAVRPRPAITSKFVQLRWPSKSTDVWNALRILWKALKLRVPQVYRHFQHWSYERSEILEPVSAPRKKKGWSGVSRSFNPFTGIPHFAVLTWALYTADMSPSENINCTQRDQETITICTRCVSFTSEYFWTKTKITEFLS